MFNESQSILYTQGSLIRWFPIFLSRGWMKKQENTAVVLHARYWGHIPTVYSFAFYVHMLTDVIIATEVMIMEIKNAARIVS